MISKALMPALLILDPTTANQQVYTDYSHSAAYKTQADIIQHSHCDRTEHTRTPYSQGLLQSAWVTLAERKGTRHLSPSQHIDSFLI